MSNRRRARVWRRTAALVGVGVGVGIVAMAGCGGAGPSSGSVGERLPSVELVGLGDAATTSLAAIDGPAVVNLWATSCAPCRSEMPDFEEVHRARGDEVTFVGINIGDDADRAAAFVSEIGVTYDQFLDEMGYVVTELRTTALPVTIVIDAEGVVTTRHLGPLDQDGLNEAIDRAIAPAQAG